MGAFETAAADILKDVLKRHPTQATMAGAHEYDSELEDVSADGLFDSRDSARRHLGTLGAFDAHSLSDDERIDHALLSSKFEVELREFDERQTHKHDPCMYTGIAIMGVYSLLMHDLSPAHERIPALCSRLGKIPNVFRAAKANLASSPRIWNEIASEETEGGLAFLRSVVAPIAAEQPPVRQALEGALNAFEDFGRFLAERCATGEGPAFAAGRSLFDFKLRREHMLPHDSRSLLLLGENAVRLTESLMTEIAAQIDSTLTWPQLIAKLREDHPCEEELLARYSQGVREARDFVVSDGLVTMPAGEVLEVVETPAFLRPTVPYAAYMPPGPFEPKQQGFYYVTPIDAARPPDERKEQMLGHNRYAMLLTNVHESYPGHHLQLVCANRCASSVRKLLQNTVFCEGWALYCEQLVLDRGMSADPRVRLFQLKDQLWRACRVVIDVKLHSGDMSFAEAVAMLVDVALLERPNAIGEVKRYTQSPTQPMSYLMGKQQILDLRSLEENRLGGAFDLRDFHDRLLSFGSIPLALIERQMSRQPVIQRPA